MDVNDNFEVMTKLVNASRKSSDFVRSSIREDTDSRIDEEKLMEKVTKKVEDLLRRNRTYSLMKNTTTICGICGGLHPMHACNTTHPREEGLKWCSYCRRYTNHATVDCFHQMRIQREQQFRNSQAPRLPMAERPLLTHTTNKIATPVLRAQTPTRGMVPFRIGGVDSPNPIHERPHQLRYYIDEGEVEEY